MKTPTAYLPRFLDRIEQMAEDRHYGKIVAKVPVGLQDVLLQRGYEAEASIPGYFQGQGACFFMSRFLHEDRQTSEDSDAIRAVLESTNNCSFEGRTESLPDGLSYARMNEEDARDMAGLYQAVFASYPFPIHDNRYLVQIGRAHV